MIALPENVPVRITPCPIVEAVFEIRFVSGEQWATMPGLLYGQIRERYREQVRLPLLEVPEQIRAQDPALMHLPLIQFKGENFIVQLGPRVVSLVTKPREYPGWPTIRDEFSWLLIRLQTAGFVREAERIGGRYIDFFAGDIFPNLRIGVRLDEQPLAANQTDLTTILRFPRASVRLQVTNGAIVPNKEGAQFGSVLDLDGWMGPTEVADLFAEGLNRATELHDIVKRVFFGLLRPDYLRQLNPVYP